MDILEFCMKMEQDGEKYYRELAKKCQIPGLKKILNLMVDDEVDHYNFFKSMKEDANLNHTGSTIIMDSKNIFKKMQEQGNTFNLEGTNIDLFKKARDIEIESEAFYLEKAKEVDSELARDLLIKIAKEERLHANLLENVLEFLSRPENWIENAEFNHLDDY